MLKTDIASDPSPVNEVGNLISGIQVTSSNTAELITDIPCVLKWVILTILYPESQGETKCGIPDRDVPFS
jgi:hypothetical protein